MFYLLAVQEILKSLLQHHNSKVYIFDAETSVRDTGKTIALTIWTFVDKMLSLLFTTMSDLS